MPKFFKLLYSYLDEDQSVRRKMEDLGVYEEQEMSHQQVNFDENIESNEYVSIKQSTQWYEDFVVYLTFMSAFCVMMYMSVDSIYYLCMGGASNMLVSWVFLISSIASLTPIAVIYDYQEDKEYYWSIFLCRYDSLMKERQKLKSD